MSDPTENIFNTSSTEEHKETTPNTNPLEDLLREVVNERGEQKYKSVEDALKGVKHSQEFIQTLASEKKSLEAQYEALIQENERLKSMEEFVLSQQNTNKEKEVHNPDDVKALIDAALNQREAVQSKTKNLSIVSDALTSVHGERAKEVFTETAQKLGMTLEALEDIAATAPQAALSLLGEAVQVANKQTKSIAPGQTAINTAAQPPTTGETFLKKPEESIMYMSDQQTLMRELENSKKMLEELESKGMNIKDLSDPTVYFKYFS